jgi:hypothetical protein
MKCLLHHDMHRLSLQDRHFYTIEVIEVESRSVLNTLTEHDFQDAFKKIAEAVGMAYTRGRGFFEVDDGQ